MLPADPSFWDQWVLDDPWPLVAGLMLVGFLLVYDGLRRQNRRELWGAMAMLLLAGAALAASTWVTTPRQAVIAQTRKLVNLTAPLDMPGLTALIEPDAPLLGPNGQVWIEGGQLLPQIQAALKLRPINGHSIGEIRAQAFKGEGPGRQAVSTVRLRTQIKESPYPGGVPTMWRMEWRLEADGQWHVTSIQWLKINNEEPMEGMWR